MAKHVGCRGPASPGPFQLFSVLSMTDILGSVPPLKVAVLHPTWCHETSFPRRAAPSFLRNKEMSAVSRWQELSLRGWGLAKPPASPWSRLPMHPHVYTECCWAALVTSPLQPEMKGLSFCFKAETLPGKTAALRVVLGLFAGYGQAAQVSFIPGLKRWSWLLLPTVFDAGVAAKHHSSCCPPVPGACHAFFFRDKHWACSKQEEMTELRFCAFNLNACI